MFSVILCFDLKRLNPNANSVGDIGKWNIVNLQVSDITKVKHFAVRWTESACHAHTAAQSQTRTESAVDWLDFALI